MLSAGFENWFVNDMLRPMVSTIYGDHINTKKMYVNVLSMIRSASISFLVLTRFFSALPV